jgi:hypothetical protein
MQAESRETTYKEKERRDPYMNSGGSAPADMGGESPEAQMDEPRGATSRNIVTAAPEETLAPSVLAHVNDPA